MPTLARQCRAGVDHGLSDSYPGYHCSRARVVSKSYVDHKLGAGRSKSIRKRLLVVIATILIVFLPAGIYFGPQVITYYKLRPFLLLRDEIPRGWSSVPQPLTDNAVANERGTKLSYFGYDIEVPWVDIDRETNEGRWAKVRFKTGQTVRFFNPAYSNVNLIDRHYASDAKDFDLAFGSEIRESKYDQLRDILSVSPKDVSPFRSHRQFARIRILLDTKGTWFEHNKTAPQILSFDTAQYRGFEISGLGNGWQNVKLHFFSKANNRSYFVGVEVERNSNVKLSQSEINCVIQSFTVPGSPPSVEQAVGWDCAADGCGGSSELVSFFAYGMVLVALASSLVFWVRRRTSGSVETPQTRNP